MVRLEDRLRAAGDWLAASCVARWADLGFVFAARIDGRRLVLSGLGGKLEPGETFRAAMLREVREETGTEVAELFAVTPRHLTATAGRHPVPGGAAALIATRPPAHPGGGTLWIAVFLGRLASTPRPVEKVELFAVVPPGAQRYDQVYVLDGDRPVPAPLALPSTVDSLDAEDTARAVLTTAGLLRDWWMSDTEQ